MVLLAVGTLCGQPAADQSDSGIRISIKVVGSESGFIIASPNKPGFLEPQESDGRPTFSRSYHLERSTDLMDWERVENESPSIIADSGDLRW